MDSSVCDSTHPCDCPSELCLSQKQYDKASISRRSIDWRDSGIVIDGDQQFNSIDAILQFTNSSKEHLISLGEPSSSGTNIPSRNISYTHDDDGDTILHLAVVGCSYEKVQDLIKVCDDLNAINNLIHTPMHVATMANRPEMVALLLQHGAKYDVQDRRGNSPLHLAAQKGLQEIVTIILNHIRAQIEQRFQLNNSDTNLNLNEYIELANFDGQSSLHLAALNDKRKILEILVNIYGANVNCHDTKSGETILHKAISMSNLDLVDFILNKLNRHCNEPDFAGRRPLDTIDILFNSRIDNRQRDILQMIKRLVENRIKFCIEKNDCCIKCNAESKKSDDQSLDAISISSTLSSDYNSSDMSD